MSGFSWINRTYGWGREWGRGVAARGGRGGKEAPKNQPLLDSLNDDVLLNATELLNNFTLEDENISKFFATKLQSLYSDQNKFINTYQNESKLQIISLNILSLRSKFAELKVFISKLCRGSRWLGGQVQRGHIINALTIYMYISHWWLLPKPEAVKSHQTIHLSFCFSLRGRQSRLRQGPLNRSA